MTEITRLLDRIGVDVHTVAPLGASADDVAHLGEADFNIVLYPETGALAASWLGRTFGQPATKTIPIGAAATRAFIAEVAALAGIDAARALANAGADSNIDNRADWYARSVDSTYLTGKRVFVFGDATHAIGAARVASAEFGFEVVCLGTYSREFARDVREAAKGYGLEALITDDYLEVEAAVAELQPELVLGTQMERHIAKRLGVPCAVISSPVHVQDFPARYSPQMGFEGANVLFDTWVHPLMMGLEEHLIGMFRGDFEFHEDAAPSHLGGSAVPTVGAAATVTAAVAPSASMSTSAPAPEPSRDPIVVTWHDEAERELRKVPFFVRGKARRNTERFALDRQLPLITVETLYDAKAHFSR